MADETPIADEIVNGQSAPKSEPKVQRVPSGGVRDLGPDMKPRTRDVVNENPERQRLKRGGAVFLDDVQRKQAEVIRAKVEGREPDLKNPPAIAGTHLLP